MPAYAVHAPHLAPSGAAHAVSLDLTTHDGYAFRGRRICHLVTARDDCVNVYEVRQKEEQEEEVSFVLLRRHRAFGVTTGLRKVQLDATADDDDGRDRLLISFKDAKMALMEWSDALMDLQTVSIHTYERAPQLSNAPPPNFLPHLAMDPVSRCAALLLPSDTLAILPFFQDAAELEMLDALEEEGNVQLERSLPYSPSFLLPFAEVDPRIKNVKDLCFLPDFQRPTVAVLCARDMTWTGRLNERRDVYSLFLITLDLTISSKHPIISTRESLPYNSLYLVACPAHLSGGVLLITNTAILHVDQGGRIVGLAVSAWHGMISNLTLPLQTLPDFERGVDLNNSHIVFAHEAGAGVRSNEAIVFLKDGTTLTLVVHMDGRTIESLELRALDSGGRKKGTPSLALALQGGQHVFTGSLLGSSELFKVGTRAKAVKEGEGVKPEEEMDLDLDDDLYGDSVQQDTSPTSGARTTTELFLTHSASLLGLGPVLDLKPCVLHQEASSTAQGGGGADVLQSVACTGAAPNGGLTFFEPKLVSRKRRRLVKLEAPRGVWTLPSASASASARNSTSLTLVSTEETSSLCSVDEEGKVEVVKKLDEATITAASLCTSSLGGGGKKLFARATPSGISVVSMEGEVVQAPTLLRSSGADAGAGADGVTAEQEVYQAHVVGRYSVLVLSNASLSLSKYNPTLTAFEPLHALTLASEQKGYTAASLFNDSLGLFASREAMDKRKAAQREKERIAREKADERVRVQLERQREVERGLGMDDEVDYEDGEGDVGMKSEEMGMGNGNGALERDAEGEEEESEEEKGKTWLVLLRNDGCIEIRDIEQADLPLLWQSNCLNPAPATLEHVPVNTDGDGDGAEMEEEGMYVARTCLALIGDVAHLVVTYENGLLVVYEAIPTSSTPSSTSSSTTSVLPLTFVKVFARQLATTLRTSSLTPALPNGTAEDEAVSTSLTPFVEFAGLTGVFVGGEQAGWLVRTPTSPLGFVLSAEKGMDAFAPFGGQGDGERGFLFSQFGTVFSASLPALSFDLDIPHRHVATGRTYTKVTAHAITRTVVAASESPMQFQLFDPEDQTVVQDPSIDPSPAYFARGSLELFTEDGGEPVDGFEFEPYETVCAIEGVTLSSVSTLEGTRDYIAVGTITAHGEDRPARGNVYIFDVVQVVPHPDDPGANFRLRMVCKDDCKAPITTIADINGFLVVTMGQKLFVRSLENDEWLVTIAFLDIPYQSTQLRRLKNYLLLSDVAKATWLIAFQESPYKLSVVAKDFIDLSATTGDYLIDDDQMAIITTATDRVVRLLDYAPTVPASQGGLKLMLRTEYRIASEPSSSLMVPGASDGGFSQQSEIVYALHNGAIETVVPVPEEVFQRLQVLQSQMVRNVQHFAGLNPRGYRAVRNELYSRPQTKGILDGLLLASFEKLPRPKMDELVGLLQGAMGEAGADQVLRDLASLRTHWGQVE